jgi:hypothetical protein
MLGLVFALCFVPLSASSNTLDQLEREAGVMERNRDCEGAYKKYEELQEQAKAMSNKRQRTRILAFTATKLSRLKECYEKCVPSETDKQYLEQAKELKNKGQNRRSYRMILRLLRGRNPNCSSWQEAHQWRKELAGQIQHKKHQTSIDPCDMEESTQQQLAQEKVRIENLRQELKSLQEPLQLPPPPDPPKWASKGQRYERWLANWKHRTQQKLRRQAESTELQRLQQILQKYREINELRERVFSWREEFQNCDEVHTALKTQSQQLNHSQSQAHVALVGLYDHRLKRFQQQMRWYASRYNKMRKDDKTDKSSFEDLRTAIQQQRELIDNLTQDLLALSNMLVFTPKKDGEGMVLQDSMGDFQRLMSDQKAMFEVLNKQFPGYMQSEQGRQQLQRQLMALERFEKALERFQDRHPGDKGEQIRQTLQAVRGSIMVLEKAEKSLLHQPSLPADQLSGSAAAMTTPTDRASAANTERGSSPWGWLLLLAGLILALGASFYLWRERRLRQFADIEHN